MPTISTTRRYIESALFVGAWMACGWLFRLSVDAYLLLGVPLLAVFQLLVRRRPLRQLWVRGLETPLRLDWLALAVAVPLMAAPAYMLFTVALPQRLWTAAVWFLFAIAGGGVAGVVLRSQRGATFRRGLPSFLAALLLGFVLMALGAVLEGGSPAISLASVPYLLQQFILYFAVSFVLEEVVFRGGLDSHVHPPSESSSRARAWGSALFVAVLWGLWHLPVAPPETGQTFADVLAVVLLVHVLEGVPLSFCWRQSGTLVLPAAAHALIDAYRNALLL